MDELQTLSPDQLRSELRQVELDLEDLEEQRLFTLGQTGVHLGAGRLKSLKDSWTRDEVRLRERKQVIETLLTH
jgi:hypothetical protein